MTQTKGWRDLTVLVSGGGIVPGYRAILPFDGREYPSNPTMAPAREMRGASAETALLGDSTYYQGRLLYPHHSKAQ